MLNIIIGCLLIVVDIWAYVSKTEIYFWPIIISSIMVVIVMSAIK